VAFVASLGLLRPQILSLEALPFKGASQAVEGLQGRALRRLPNFAEGGYTAIERVNVPRAGRLATPKCCRGLKIGAVRGVRRRGVITQSQGIKRAV